MTEGVRPETAGGNPFEGIDPKLNVFALANGMDLAKADRHRRLEWFTEGLERGIQVELDDAGGFSIHVLSWKTGSSEILGRAQLGGGLSDADLVAILPSAIEAANAL